MATKNLKILYQSFNQDLNYFLIGTEEGCTIYKTDSFKEGNISKYNFIFFIYLKNRNKRSIFNGKNVLLF